MKGIIFNLLEEVVSRESGEQAWDQLLAATQSRGLYTSLGNYPSAELEMLIAALAAIQQKASEDVIRWFAAKALPLLAAKYPTFFQGHDGTRSFLLTLNDVIHPEVRKIYPGADVPTFTYETNGDDGLVMIYHSSRKLCVLAEGFIHGAADHFGENVSLRQSECMHRGHQRCVFHLSFAKRGA